MGWGGQLWGWGRQLRGKAGSYGARIHGAGSYTELSWCDEQLWDGVSSYEGGQLRVGWVVMLVGRLAMGRGGSEERRALTWRPRFLRDSGTTYFGSGRGMIRSLCGQQVRQRPMSLSCDSMSLQLQAVTRLTTDPLEQSTRKERRVSDEITPPTGTLLLLLTLNHMQLNTDKHR